MGGLWAAAALLDAAAIWILVTSPGVAEALAGGGAILLSTGGLWWARRTRAPVAALAAAPPPCTYRPAREGESAADYYGLRDIPAGELARPAPARRFARTDPAAGGPTQPVAAGPTGSNTPAAIDWSDFDAARAAYTENRPDGRD